MESGMTFSFVQQTFFLVSLVVASGAFIYTIHDFLAPVFWGTVLTIIFYPMFERFKAVMGSHAWLASIGTIIVILGVVIVPLFVVGKMAVSESIRIYESVQADGIVTKAQGSLSKSITVILPHLHRFGITETTLVDRVENMLATGSRFVANSLVFLGQFTVSIIVNLLVMLYLLFFMFRDGEKIMQYIQRLLPLGDDRENRLFGRFAKTTRAVIRGTILIGILQGVMGGILFALVGIDAAVLWGVLMAILSVIPGMGPAIIWLPAGILLILGGSVFEGLVVLLGGTLVVGLIDNAVRPVLVGHDAGMSDALVLLSTIGGLAVFGISGFVIGPIIAAVCIAFWELFEEMYRNDIAING